MKPCERVARARRSASLPSLGAWIETTMPVAARHAGCRSLHWGRGLKHPRVTVVAVNVKSLPSLGAWIETRAPTRRTHPFWCRSLHWGRGLKRVMMSRTENYRRRSLPSLGAWIETSSSVLSFWIKSSLPSLGAWIETSNDENQNGNISASLPSLGAWIETLKNTRTQNTLESRSLHWGRGLKLIVHTSQYPRPRRSLHWGRGLKRTTCHNCTKARPSLPSLGAWIETKNMTKARRMM